MKTSTFLHTEFDMIGIDLFEGGKLINHFGSHKMTGLDIIRCIDSAYLHVTTIRKVIEKMEDFVDGATNEQE